MKKAARVNAMLRSWKNERDLPNRLNGVKEVAFARCRDIRGVSTLREFILVRFNELMFDHDVANAVDGERWATSE